MDRFEEAKKQYNKTLNSLGLEFLTIGTSFSENTDNWNLRDMVSEAQYQLDVCYEEDNANADGRTVAGFMEIYSGASREEAEEAHAEWLKKTRALRAFIRKYQAAALKEKCTQGHCSKFD
jgi:hypothetical protein